MIIYQASLTFSIEEQGFQYLQPSICWLPPLQTNSNTPKHFHLAARRLRKRNRERSLRHITMVAKFLDDNKPKTSFYFFGHRWSRYFILLSATRICRKKTGYDLQLHLRYRNSIWNKETEINIIHAQKCLYVTRKFYRFLHQRWAKFSSAKWFKMIQDFSRPNKEIKYFSRT